MNVDLIVEAVQAAFWTVAAACVCAVLFWPVTASPPGRRRAPRGWRP